MTTAPPRSTTSSASGGAPAPTAETTDPSTSTHPDWCSVPASSIVTIHPFASNRRTFTDPTKAL